MYKPFVLCAEIISEYFAFLESGVPLPNFDHYQLAKQAKMCALRFGIVSSKTCNADTCTRIDPNGIKWCKSGQGITKTMLHSIFDETANNISRFGIIRNLGCKCYELFLGLLRNPTLQHGSVIEPSFYSKCTQKYADNVSINIAIEHEMYVISGKYIWTYCCL